MKNIVIIDPIFRGSRLFYTKMVATLGEKVTILTRTGSRTEASSVAFAGRAIELREVVTTDKASWYYHLNNSQLRELGAALHRLLDAEVPDLLFISGLDEVASGIAGLLGEQAGRLANTKVIGIHYTPLSATRSMMGRFRIPSALEGRFLSGRFLRLVRDFTLLKSKMPGLRVGLLDERISATVRPADLFTFFPDPPPEYSEPSHQLLRKIQLGGGDPTLLLVGRQSERKGFDDIRKLVETVPDALPRKTRLVLCGSFEESVAEHSGFIKSRDSLFLHIDRYLSDAEIRAHYESADYVLIPYKASFNGSSGVLASAASFGVPVIATNHGLIGYRVRKNGLGFTYPSGNTRKLRAVLQSLPARGSQDYERMCERCLDFSRRNSVTAFHSKLRFVIENNP